MRLTATGPGGRRAAAPSSARLLASVPQPVKTTCAGAAPASAATCARACSTAMRAARPKRCTLAGLP